MTHFPTTAVLAALLAVAPRPDGSKATVRGVVREAGTGAPVSGAHIELLPQGWTAEADADGAFAFVSVPDGWEVTLRVSRLGYVPADTTVQVGNGLSVVIHLDPAPIQLEGLLARGYRLKPRTDRELFETEVQPGLVGVSRRELTEVPALGEVDVLRSLQALPSVIPTNDLDATLHVMGGGPDQNLFLWDGARVFAPYHMFGVFGAFPGKAVEGVEFYRGAIPARFGRAVSSVVDLHQRAGGTYFSTDATLGLLAASFSTEGALGRSTGGWHVSGRRTTLDLVGGLLRAGQWPYAFHDASGSLWLSPAPGHLVRGSFFLSGDRFDGLSGGDLRSKWRNTALSGEWLWDQGDDRTLRAHASWSGYTGYLDLGGTTNVERTSDAVGVGSLLLEWDAPFLTGTVRTGAAVDGGTVELRGSDEPGGYVEGVDVADVLTAAAYAETDLEFGSLRVSPGLRLDVDVPRRRSYLQPRASARVPLTSEISLTAAAGRNTQLLSTLQDGRNVLPGAALWLGPTEGRPAQRSDNLSLALDAWLHQEWSFNLGIFGRLLADVPDWRPEGTRTLDQVSFSDGHAVGFELMARRYGQGVTGWLAYGLSRVALTDADGADYAPPWDRRHSLDAAIFVPVSDGGSLSARFTLGSGTPFWPFLGYIAMPRLNPLNGQLRTFQQTVPYWANDQARMPVYARLDVGAHLAFEAWGARWRPFFNVLNATGYPNVLYYEPPVGTDGSEQIAVLSSPIRVIPSLGVDVSF